MSTEPVAQSEAVFNHHLQSIISKDLEAVLSDYSEDSVMFTPQGPIVGLEALSNFFSSTFMPLINEEFLRRVTILRQDVVGDTAYFLWKVPGTFDLATDTYFIRNGKIVSQSFTVYPL